MSASGPADGVAQTRAGRRSAVVTAVVALAAAVLLLGPALGPGPVLTYDMVWVPDLAMLRDVLGLGSALPRAVPSDAVVAALDEVVPGVLLQKVVLLGSLTVAGVGAGRLVAGPLVVRLGAVVLYEWNAFVVERLLIGHWPVLVGYALLPWLLLAARAWRESGRRRPPTVLLVLMPLASLSASAGLASAVVLVAAAAGRGRRRVLLALVAAANAPWVVAGLAHASAATTDPAGARAFALNGEGDVPAPLAALSLGGIWNTEVVPGSRTGVLGWVTLAVVLTLAALGARRWWGATSARERTALLWCWGLGWAGAVATWAIPGPLGALGETVPGLALARDGGRLLALCAPLVVLLVAHGVGELASRARLAAPAALAVALLMPVALLPDAAWGAAGRLDPARYPESWIRVRDALQARPTPGDLLVLPLTAFRAPQWNHDRTVFDPLGRYLGRPYVASDVLVVSGRPLAGEDPRVAAATAALARPTARARTDALLRAGIGAVVVDAAAPAGDRVPALEGDDEVVAGTLRVVRLDGDPARSAPVEGVAEAAVVLAWALWTALAGAGAAGVLTCPLRKRRERGA